MGVIDIKIDNHDVVVHVFNTNRFMKLFPNYKSIPMRTNDYGYTHRLEAEINGIKIIALRSVEREWFRWLVEMRNLHHYNMTIIALTVTI